MYLFFFLQPAIVKIVARVRKKINNFFILPLLRKNNLILLYNKQNKNAITKITLISLLLVLLIFPL
jgi:hypothetical protein